MTRSRRLGARAARYALLGYLPLSTFYLHCAAEPPAPEEFGQARSGLSVILADCTSASLAAAITSANTATTNGDPGPHSIALKAGCTYTLTAPDNFWYGPTGLPPIASDLTLEGNGAIIERSSAMGTPNLRLLFVAGPPTP